MSQIESLQVKLPSLCYALRLRVARSERRALF
eukprot:COSAG03_NODE_14159_length_474_cov_2.288000_1_plen_31_part_10